MSMSGRTGWTTMLALLAVLVIAATSLAAETPGRADISYSADLRIQAGGSKPRLMTGRIFHTKDAERREHLHDGTKSIVIIRWDRKLGWLLNPANNTYTRISLTRAVQFRGLPTTPATSRRKIGRATVNGVPTTKYKVSTIRRDGKPFRGFMWVSDDGVVMKLVSDSGADWPYALELDKLRVGAQDQALFEPPRGWRKIALPKASAKSGGRQRGITEADIRRVEQQMRARGATEAQIQAFRRHLKRQMQRKR